MGYLPIGAPLLSPHAWGLMGLLYSWKHAHATAISLLITFERVIGSPNYCVRGQVVFLLGSALTA